MCTLKNNVYWCGQYISFKNGWRRAWWYKDRFKDCCIHNHYWLWWGLLWLFYWLLRHHKRRLDWVPEIRSIRHLWPLCWCCGLGLCAYGRKCPSVSGLFCQWLHWARKEWDVWTGLTISSCKSNKSMYGTNPEIIKVLGHLHYTCSMTSQTRSFKIGQECVLVQSENWFAASLVCARLF